jgi:hypothetical protein
MMNDIREENKNVIGLKALHGLMASKLLQGLACLSKVGLEKADKVTNRIPEFSELTPDMQLEHEGHLWAAVAGLHVVGTSLIFNFCERVLP